MRFLGAETALPCVGGRQLGNFPRPLASTAKTGGISGGADSGRYSGSVLQGCGGRLERTPARRRTNEHELFFVETVPKRYMFGTSAPRKWLRLE
jgi:hypothetical protein